MNHIIPTIFATNQMSFNSRFEKLIKISKDIQIDIMDGNFVTKESILMKQIPDLKKHANNFEAHLMAKHPEKYISEAKKLGFKKIIFHYESYWNKYKCLSLIKKIKSLKMQAFIAINPETSVSKILLLLPFVDGVLFLGVHPGREHQHFVSRVYNKISFLRDLDKKIIIQVDGGVNDSNISKLRQLGVNYFNSGSYISDNGNAKKALETLREK